MYAFAISCAWAVPGVLVSATVSLVPVSGVVFRATPGSARCVGLGYSQSGACLRGRVPCHAGQSQVCWSRLQLVWYLSQGSCSVPRRAVPGVLVSATVSLVPVSGVVFRATPGSATDWGLIPCYYQTQRIARISLT